MTVKLNIAQEFEEVGLWIFDLDNTLYPRSEGLWRQVDARMREFISDRLGLDDGAAHSLQKQYFRDYGLTMRGLMLHHGVDADAFNIHVHDVDLSDISPNPELGEAISSLPGRKVIHSNANIGHVERVLERLKITCVFNEIYDISTTNYHPKPSVEAYRAVLAKESATASNCAMFEDIAHNLVEPHALGMRTVWTPTGCDWASDGADAEHVHFVAENMIDFVRMLGRERQAA